MNTLRLTLGGLVAAAAFSMGGCKNMDPLPDVAPSQVRVNKSPAGTLDNVVEQRKGEQGHGVIYHLGNIHHTDEMNDSSKRQVGTYQVRVWRALEKLRPDAVFAEENAYGDGPIDEITMKAGELKANAGTPGNATPAEADKDINVYGAVASQTRTLFPHGLPAQPSDQQLVWLGTHGAFVAYCAVHPDVPLQRVLNWTEWQAIKENVENELARNNNNVNASNAPTCFGVRENMTVRHINDYLAAHPDARVALVYGMRHEFGRALDASGNKSALLFWKGGPIIVLPATDGKR